MKGLERKLEQYSLPHQETKKEPTMQAIIQAKEVYGETKFYPVNDIALSLAKIAGTKTLTVQTIAEAKRMGIEFEVQYKDLKQLIEAFN